MCAEGGGTKALIANRPRPSVWEHFEFVGLKSNLTGIRSKANKKFCDEIEGQLIPTRPKCVDDDKETNFKIVFLFVDHTIVGVKSLKNEKYLTVDEKEHKPLSFRGDYFGECQMFKLFNTNSLQKTF